MYKKNVTVIFDRLGAVKKTGRGKVEIRVYLDRNVRKCKTTVKHISNERANNSSAIPNLFVSFSVIKTRQNAE